MKKALIAGALMAAVAGCVLIAACVSSAPATPAVYTFTDSDNGKTVEVTEGSKIYVKLSENPTTGYQWEMSATSGLTLINDEYQQTPGSEGMTGAGGVHTFEYKANGSGQQQISGIYKRSWEETTGSEDTFSLTLDVAPL